MRKALASLRSDRTPAAISGTGGRIATKSLAELGEIPTQWLGSGNLVQSFNNLNQFLWGCAANHLPNPFDRERSDLADFDP
jgi:hypothetical protein